MPGPTIDERFPTAATSAPPSDETKARIVAMRSHVVELAEYIEALVPEGRDKSLALTALEDVLMRANRAIYAHRPPVDERTPTNQIVEHLTKIAELTAPARDFECCETGTCRGHRGPDGLAAGGSVSTFHVRAPLDLAPVTPGSVAMSHLDAQRRRLRDAYTPGRG
ncbi:DUF7681 family protein [Microbacterium trichothecenolyticum]|nr:hypothetical protein [Microbacterium trichothecenolyticum]